MRAIYAWSCTAVALAMLAGGASLASAASDTQGDRCKVTVDRSMAADTYQVTRQKLDNGDCVCYLFTGPQGQSAGTEKEIADLLSSRRCDDKAAFVPNSSASAGGKFPIGALVGAGAVAGGVAAVASGGGGGGSGGGGSSTGG